jgi:hypothetical protein
MLVRMLNAWPGRVMLRIRLDWDSDLVRPQLRTYISRVHSVEAATVRDTAGPAESLLSP